MNRVMVAASAAAIAVSLAFSARAEIFTYTVSGVVSSGVDIYGDFGTAGADLSSETYSVVYTLDTSLPHYVTGQPGAIDVQTGYYGASLYFPPDASTAVTVGGGSYTVQGSQDTDISATHHYYGRDTVTFVAQDEIPNSYWYRNVAVVNEIWSSVNDFTNDALVIGETNYNVQSSDGAYGDFSDSRVVPGTSQWLTENIYLKPTEIQVSGPPLPASDLPPPTQIPVSGTPEPATWAMLILGVGMIGFTARRRREGLASAV